MASRNPFELLDDDTEDSSVVIAAAQEKKLSAAAVAATAAKKPSAAAHYKPTKLASKPFPPPQAVREARNEPVRRSARGQGRGDYYRGLLPGEMAHSARDIENGFSLDVELKKSSERRGPDGIRGIYRMAKRDDVNNAEGFEWERTRRVFERHSGTGRGAGIKRDGAGRGNWGSPTDEITQEPVAESEANGAAERPLAGEENGDADKEIAVKEPEEKEPEEMQMTLEEYEKVLEEKRRALLSLQGEVTKGVERKVDVKEFHSMQLVSKKKNDDEVFVQLGSKDSKKDTAAERVKKTVPIEEFLSDYKRRGRGYNRAREGNGGRCPMDYAAAAPVITDVRQFPLLGGQ